LNLEVANLTGTKNARIIERPSDIELPVLPGMDKAGWDPEAASLTSTIYVIIYSIFFKT
jgi:hypothetical protein